MKILNVNASLDPVHGGGTAERTVQMSRFLAARGHDCTVLTMDLGLTSGRARELAGARLVALPCLSERFYVPRTLPATIRRLIADSDVVHLMSHWSVLNALVYASARALGKPYVICPAGALPIFGRSRLLKRLYNVMVGNNIIRNAAGGVAISPDEFTHFACAGMKRESVFLIPNGIAVGDYVVRDDAAFRRAHGLGDRPFILFVGRLNAVKGPDLLLGAFLSLMAAIPHQLVFAGPDGGMLDELQAMAKRGYAGDRVRFLGYIGLTEKSRAYHAAELLAIPSRSEAMSIVVLEAGASGTPVLLTDRCGFDEIARIGGGCIVPAGAEGIARGLAHMLSGTLDLRSMGTTLKRHVEQRYTWDSIVVKYLAMYERILGASSAAASVVLDTDLGKIRETETRIRR